MVTEGHRIVSHVIHKCQISHAKPFRKIQISGENVTCIQKQAVATFISNLVHQGRTSRYIGQMSMGIVRMHNCQFPRIGFRSIVCNVKLQHGNCPANLISYKQQRASCRTVLCLNELQSFRPCVSSKPFIKLTRIHIVHKYRLLRVSDIIGHHSADPFQSDECQRFAANFTYRYVLRFGSFFRTAVIFFHLTIAGIKIIRQTLSCNSLEIAAAVIHLRHICRIPNRERAPAVKIDILRAHIARCFQLIV
ncbi:hypothetical protein D3C78_892540 [compost metagenome]